MTEVVVGAQVPFSVPSMFLHCLYHVVYSLLCTVGLVVVTEMTAERDVVSTRDNEESSDHQTLSLGSFALVLRCLEALVGVP